MHSNVRFMLRKNVATVPLSSGAIRIYDQENRLIHLIINQIVSL